MATIFRKYAFNMLFLMLSFFGGAVLFSWSGKIVTEAFHNSSGNVTAPSIFFLAHYLACVFVIFWLLKVLSHH